jgi:Mg2+/Co2+ transporter CorB
MYTPSVALISTFVLLVLMSSYFSATETAFSSLNRIRLIDLEKNGNKKAALALKLYNNYDNLLSTILIGNNMVNISAASIAAILFIDAFGDIGATLSTVVTTVIVLTFGEVIPKTLTKDSPERFAMLSSPVIRLLMIVFKPLNFLFSLIKKLCLNSLTLAAKKA